MASQHHLYLAIWANSTNTVVKWTVVVQSIDEKSKTWLDSWGAVNFSDRADELMTVIQNPVEFRGTETIVGVIDVAEITPEHYTAIKTVLGDIGVERPDGFERTCPLHQ